MSCEDVQEFLTLGARYSWSKNYNQTRRENLFRSILERVKRLGILREEGSKLKTTNVKSEQSFGDIFQGLEDYYSKENILT